MNILTIIFIDAIALLFLTGFYSLLVSRNLIRVLIALEILTKAATLMLILAGYWTKQTGLAQAFVITLIIVEVVVIAVAAGIVIGIFRHTGTLDTRHLRNLKG
jgi:NADH-quinone oxidoreductase subunit K